MTEQDIPAQASDTTDDADRIRTVYLTGDNHEALHSIATAQSSNGSAVLRGIFQDYLAGKFSAAPVRPRKTTMWAPPSLWEQVRTKAQGEGASVTAVVNAGIARLRGGRR